jgi:16S rRNA (cytosine967-C5)-methyltransferase
VVTSVAFEGHSSEEALRLYDESPQRSAIMAIALGSIRWYLRLWPAIEGLLARPQGIANEIRALLVVSAHQIEYSRNAPEAAAHAAVDATRILSQGRASGLVNAVLRRFVAERSTLLARVDQSLAGRTAHPFWLVKLLEQALPESHGAILAANNEHPPLVLRVDLSRKSRSSYIEELARADIGASPIEWAPAAIRLDRPMSVPLLPGFREGVVSVQDAGAQLAAQLLDAQPGMRVLDACAAPGGKTGHLLEHTPGLSDVWAIDADPERVIRIHENLDRLGRKAHVVVADVRDPSTFWDGRPFDRILVDAPCSSTGVIRRHPDIKLLRRPTDIPAFAALQEQILRCAFGMLGVGGRLVYCTCSLLPQENEQLVGRLLESEPTARVATSPPLSSLVPGAIDKKVGIQLVPGSEAGSDGFYYACVEKTTAGT